MKMEVGLLKELFKIPKSKKKISYNKKIDVKSKIEKITEYCIKELLYWEADSEDDVFHFLFCAYQNSTFGYHFTDSRSSLALKPEPVDPRSLKFVQERNTHPTRLVETPGHNLSKRRIAVKIDLPEEDAERVGPCYEDLVRKVIAE